MIRRNLGKAAVALASAAMIVPAAQLALAHQNGVVKTRSAYSMQETVDRIKRDIAAKNIKLFDVIDQARLAKDVGIDLNPSTLIIFGNPPLGTQFLTATPESGRGRSGMDRTLRFRLDRSPAQHQKPGFTIQDGIGGYRFHYIEYQGAIAAERKAITQRYRTHAAKVFYAAAPV